MLSPEWPQRQLDQVLCRIIGMQQIARQEPEFSVPLLHTCARNVRKKVKCHYKMFGCNLITVAITASRPYQLLSIAITTKRLQGKQLHVQVITSNGN